MLYYAAFSSQCTVQAMKKKTCIRIRANISCKFVFFISFVFNRHYINTLDVICKWVPHSIYLRMCLVYLQCTITRHMDLLVVHTKSKGKTEYHFKQISHFFLSRSNNLVLFCLPEKIKSIFWLCFSFFTFKI